VGVSDVVERVLSGDVRAVARVCRAVDDRIDGYLDVLKALHRHTGNAWVIGVTGNPGAGKSTLTDRLVVSVRPNTSIWPWAPCSSVSVSANAATGSASM
jgi:LAO/AO transport system kinase